MNIEQRIKDATLSLAGVEAVQVCSHFKRDTGRLYRIVVAYTGEVLQDVVYQNLMTKNLRPCACELLVIPWGSSKGED